MDSSLSLALLLLVLAPGGVCLFWQKKRFGRINGEALVVSALASVVTTSALGIILLELSRFRLPYLLAGLAIVTIVSALLIMRAFNRLGEKSEVDSFKTAGLLYLIGILLSLVVIGVVVMWIAFIFAAISFYRLKPLPPPTAAPVYQPPPPPIVQTTVCPNCGAVNNPEAVYCKNCGTHL